MAHIFSLFTITTNHYQMLWLSAFNPHNNLASISITSSYRQRRGTEKLRISPYVTEMSKQAVWFQTESMSLTTTLRTTLLSSWKLGCKHKIYKQVLHEKFQSMSLHMVKVMKKELFLHYRHKQSFLTLHNILTNAFGSNFVIMSIQKQIEKL